MRKVMTEMMMNPMRKTKRELVKILKLIEHENQALKIEALIACNSNVDTLNQIDKLHDLIEELENEKISLSDRITEESSKNRGWEDDDGHGSIHIQQGDPKDKETIFNLETLVEELSLLIQRLSAENEQIKHNDSIIRLETEHLKKKIERLTMKKQQLNREKKRLETENRSVGDQLDFFDGIFQSEEKMYIVVDDNLNIVGVSNDLNQQLYRGREWRERPLCEVITVDKAEKNRKMMKKIQAVLDGKKRVSLKSIHLKLTPLKTIKANAQAIRSSLRKKPAVMISF